MALIPPAPPTIGLLSEVSVRERLSIAVMASISIFLHSLQASTGYGWRRSQLRMTAACQAKPGRVRVGSGVEVS